MMGSIGTLYLETGLPREVGFTKIDLRAEIFLMLCLCQCHGERRTGVGPSLEDGAATFSAGLLEAARTEKPGMKEKMVTQTFRRLLDPLDTFCLRCQLLNS